MSVYHSPEANGLEVVAELHENESYQFNILIVWRHMETGKLYWEHDSGCSCPTPFEDYETLSSLNQLTCPGDREAIRDMADGMDVDKGDVIKFLQVVERELRNIGKSYDVDWIVDLNTVKN